MLILPSPSAVFLKWWLNQQLSVVWPAGGAADPQQQTGSGVQFIMNLVLGSVRVYCSWRCHLSRYLMKTGRSGTPRFWEHHSWALLDVSNLFFKGCRGFVTYSDPFMLSFKRVKLPICPLCSGLCGATVSAGFGNDFTDFPACSLVNKWKLMDL